MPTNVFFNHAVSSEQHLYEDLVVESLRMYGQETFYLPRQIVETDTILDEDVQSKFGDAYSVEMYIENAEGFEGEGDLMSKFGVEIRDQATFVLSVRSWERFVSTDQNLATSLRPNEGDLIYLPLSGSLFEIKFVEHEQPFYQVGKLFVFKLQAELFEYAGEDFDTGTDADFVEEQQAYRVDLRMNGSGAYTIGEDVTLSGNVVGEVVSYSEDVSPNQLEVIHVTTTFRVGDTIVGATSGTSRTISSITDILTMSQDGNAQNLDFEGKADNYLDFSETNPFGEVT
ncbi:MAG: hypothetical protein CMD25_04810 [Flavobacteriales bacterium]|nr:hypothetical protein [Flavobacteriales bacterium]